MRLNLATVAIIRVVVPALPPEDVITQGLLHLMDGNLVLVVVIVKQKGVLMLRRTVPKGNILLQIFQKMRIDTGFHRRPLPLIRGQEALGGRIDHKILPRVIVSQIQRRLCSRRPSEKPIRGFTVVTKIAHTHRLQAMAYPHQVRY